MKKIILLIAVLTIGLTQTDLLAQGKIGYVNPQEVLEQLPEREAIERKLREFVQLKQAEFDVSEEAFLNNVRSLQERVQAQTISDAEVARQRAALEEQQEELYTLLDSQQLELQRRQEELLRPILLSIDQAIAAVANEMKLDYVLNELTTGGDSILLFVSTQGQQSLNITDKVIQKLK
jgi:outer membrane protein